MHSFLLLKYIVHRTILFIRTGIFHRRRLTVRDHFFVPASQCQWPNDVEWTESHRWNGGAACLLNWERAQLFVLFGTLYPENPLSLLPRILSWLIEPSFISKLKSYWLSADRPMQWRASDGTSGRFIESLSCHALYFVPKKRANFETQKTFYRKIKRDYTFTTVSYH